MDYQTLSNNYSIWNDYINHDFVNQLAAGTLSEDSFRHRDEYMHHNGLCC
ncbi:hypothetical protein [Psychrobacter urativorans]|nr:hypothetical protein [Psychrobacter urativorans]